MRKTGEEMLRAIYDYLMDNINYRKGKTHAFGDNSRSVKAVKRQFVHEYEDMFMLSPTAAARWNYCH